MKVAAVIAEYNPFHNGHLYLLQKIRQELGEDTAIIAIMSGNFVQRGDAAFIDKWARAEAAVKCGVNLVLELPFPYSSSSAEFFARAGVYIAERIGVVDALCFGSESGEIDTISNMARNLDSHEFKSKLREICDSEEAKNIGHAILRERAYSEIFGRCDEMSSPNNILGIEYIRALNRFKSAINPITFTRCGASYNSDKIGVGNLQSATAVRDLMKKDFNSARKYVPKNAFSTFSTQQEYNSLPCELNRLSTAIITHLRLSSGSVPDIHDAAGGLYTRLRNKSFEASDLNTLIELVKTKKYTTSRICRVILYSLLGVTSSDVERLPEFTQILALDTVGQAVLREIKKNSDFAIITKPSAIPDCEVIKAQKALSDKADSIFELMKPSPDHGNAIYKKRPFVLSVL